jgi:hypothetical protein
VKRKRLLEGRSGEVVVIKEERDRKKKTVLSLSCKAFVKSRDFSHYLQLYNLARDNYSA